ncbi:hypothetical protein AHMF7605_14685 [Adhaeribacter arboris]|uniref:STAS/SEC14 domain-containing protein n=1 Tax=Adhaeribacter arboris TaxID=2072846 RepID=A0A2T2YGL5_9BACT|nr:hypothetical protein [Adhaeribacter arboris]PSR54666.1 hypothetical protein AHMF7605_14685 [Adhaeribacter arboris]
MTDTSTTLLVFEDEKLKIGVNTETSLLRLTWLQHPTSETYRQGYRQAIMIALEYKTKFWLTDSRKVQYLYMADQYWMYAKMRPLLKGGKLLKFAIVLQPETLMMTDRQPILDNSGEIAKPNLGFNLEFFLDLDSASSWLLGKNE